MKIDPYTEILPEDLKSLDKDYGEDLETLLGAINSLGSNLNLLAKQALNLGDNIQADLRAVTVKAATDLPVIIANKFSPQPPRVVLPVNSAQPVSITWSTTNKNQIQVTSFTSTVSYPVTVTLLILW